MRIYLSGQEDVAFDFIQERDHSFIIEDNIKREIFFKEVAGKNFFSFDKLNWKKVFKFTHVDQFYDRSNEIKVSQGFKPTQDSDANAGSLVSQMPGKIVKVLVSENDEVKKGDTLLILEAMKMENEIKSGVDGVVNQVNVSVGESIDSGFVMMEVSSPDIKD